jgi:hypothetical protein
LAIIALKSFSFYIAKDTFSYQSLYGRFCFINKVSSACGLVYYGIKVGMPHLYLELLPFIYKLLRECRFDQVIPVLLTQGISGAFCSHEE